MFGAALMLLVVLDVFLTVLHARIGTGIISHRLARGTWRAFRWIAAALPRWQNQILSLCGPTILVLLVATWMIGLMFGAAWIIHPCLGTSVTATGAGPTPTDFITALYVAGDSLTTVGTSDLAPRSGFFRILYTLTSLLGISVITLTLTYFLEIYNSLQRRNTFALKVHLATAETGDAAELVAGLGAEGKFDPGYTQLAEFGAEMMSFKESHHFYSVLLHFRFSETHYAVSRLALVTLDSVTLIKSALDDRDYAWFKESAAVDQLWRATMRMMVLLADSFLPGGVPEPVGEPDEATRDRWRRRYFAGVRRLRQAGIKTIADEEAGATVYVSLRQRWDNYVGHFGRYMAQDLDNIDPIGCDPDRAQVRQEFRTRLRAAG
jgi:hypothetical protein